LRDPAGSRKVYHTAAPGAYINYTVAAAAMHWADDISSVNALHHLLATDIIDISLRAADSHIFTYATVAYN